MVNISQMRTMVLEYLALALTLGHIFGGFYVGKSSSTIRFASGMGMLEICIICIYCPKRWGDRSFQLR